MSNIKRLIFVLIIIIALISLYSLSISTNSKKSDKFIGTVKSVEDKSVIIIGSFEDEKGSKALLYEYEIYVDSNAEIVKTSFVLPKDGKMFEMNKLPKETASVDFQTFKKDSQNVSIGLEVILARNFIGQVQRKAKQIKYIGPKY